MWGFFGVVIGLWEAVYWIRATGELNLVMVDGVFFLSIIGFVKENGTQRGMGHFEFLN